MKWRRRVRRHLDNFLQVQRQFPAQSMTIGFWILLAFDPPQSTHVRIKPTV